MIHRYFASTLGLVILAILALCIRARKNNPQVPLKLPLFLAALVIFQGLLGMWTVTLGLFPTIVMAHLLGGFTTLCLLFLLAVRLHNGLPVAASGNKDSEHAFQKKNAVLRFGIIGIVILGLQIALGGWTAANYAATVCSELPICQSGWQQHVNISDAFQFWGHGVEDYEFATHLGADAKITIHVAHRVGAIITTLYLGSLFVWLLVRSNQTPVTRKAASIALLTLIAQVESAGRTRVLLLDDCPNGLKGFYAPARNRIGLCRNNHSSDAALTSTLLHEAMHRLQHCRQPELSAQLDSEQRVDALEEEARDLQRWGDQTPKAAAEVPVSPRPTTVLVK